MTDRGKKSVLGIAVDAIDTEAAVARVFSAVEKRTPLAGTALAVHGVMTGVRNSVHKNRLNRLDLVVPDGQPVRWALNLLYKVGLRERVYGPDWMLALCKEAEQREASVFLFGNRPEVLEKLGSRLIARFPRLRIAGSLPSQFRRLSNRENSDLAQSIRATAPSLVFVGLGCPRQEVWIFENRETIGVPLIAVGAAFDFHAGNLPQAPPALQRIGLEWFFRLSMEPRRLWRRYVLLNPIYLLLLVMQFLRIYVPRADLGVEPTRDQHFG